MHHRETDAIAGEVLGGVQPAKRREQPLRPGIEAGAVVAHEEGVALAVGRKDGGIAVAEGLEQAGAALDVGEQQGEGAGREYAHRSRLTVGVRRQYTVPHDKGACAAATVRPANRQSSP